jgi:hypothetical protein
MDVTCIESYDPHCASNSGNAAIRSVRCDERGVSRAEAFQMSLELDLHCPALDDDQFVLLISVRRSNDAIDVRDVLQP